MTTPDRLAGLVARWRATANEADMSREHEAYDAYARESCANELEQFLTDTGLVDEMRDVERMDYLEAVMVGVNHIGYGDYEFYGWGKGPMGRGMPTLRQQIDEHIAALAAQKEPK